MTTPAGGLMLAQYYCGLTLADAAAFRTWVGAETQAEALLRIHHDGTPPPSVGDANTREQLIALRPYALIYTAPQAGYKRRRIATETWDESGRLVVVLEQSTPPDLAADVPAAERRWKNTIGELIDDLLELAYVAGYLAIDEIEVLDGPYRSHPDTYAELGDFQGVDLAISWGQS